MFVKPDSRVLLASVSFIVLELYKAISDHNDRFDVFLAIMAILYLSVPILRVLQARMAKARTT